MYLTAVTYEVAVIDSVVILQGTQRKGLMNTAQYIKNSYSLASQTKVDSIELATWSPSLWPEMGRKKPATTSVFLATLHSRSPKPSKPRSLTISLFWFWTSVRRFFHTHISEAFQTGLHEPACDPGQSKGWVWLLGGESILWSPDGSLGSVLTGSMGLKHQGKCLKNSKSLLPGSS